MQLKFNQSVSHGNDGECIKFLTSHMILFG